MLISSPTIPEVVFERIKSDVSEFAFNFFQDGLTFDVIAKTYKFRLKASGVQVLEKTPAANAGGRVLFVLSATDKIPLTASEYSLSLIEVLVGGGERTIVMGTLRWSVPAGKNIGLVSAPDVSVNYIAATGSLMVALGVVDFGSSSSALSAAAAANSRDEAKSYKDAADTIKNDVSEIADQVNEDKVAVDAAAADVTQKKLQVDTNLAQVISIAQTVKAEYYERGDYNVATNSPTLTADATVGAQTGTNSKPQRYNIVVGGNLAFAIKDYPAGSALGLGYLIQHPNGQWYFNPSSGAALTKVINLENKLAPVRVDVADNDLNLIESWADPSGSVYFGWDNKGNISNPDFLIVKVRLSAVEGNLTAAVTAANNALGLATTANLNANIAIGLAPKEVELNPLNIEDAKTDAEGNVYWGLKANGDIINPMIQKMWDAIFNNPVVANGAPLAISDTKIMFSNFMFCVENRPFSIYGPSLLPTRNKNNDAYTFAIQSINANQVPFQALFQNSIRINPSEIGNTVTIKARNPLSSAEWSKLIGVKKGAANKVATPRVLVIGDSISRGNMNMLASKFAGMGVQPVWLGTSKGPSVNISNEARGGWEGADFVYIKTDYVTPLPVGSESGYSTYNNINPFIRPAIAGDDPTKVKNGYIFDLRFFLNRFNFPDPDIVIYNTSTNDISGTNGVSVGLANSIEANRIIIDSIKSSCPNCKIGIANVMYNDSPTTNEYWPGFVSLFQDNHAKYAGRTSEGIYLISSHAYMTDWGIYPTSILETDPQTGMTKETNLDRIHSNDHLMGSALYSEVIFSFIYAIS